VLILVASGGAGNTVAPVKDIAFHNVPFLPLSTPKSPYMSQFPVPQVLTTSSSRRLAPLEVITVRYHF
jgi:hypothetical protein